MVNHKKRIASAVGAVLLGLAAVPGQAQLYINPIVRVSQPPSQEEMDSALDEARQGAEQKAPGVPSNRITVNIKHPDPQIQPERPQGPAVPPNHGRVLYPVKPHQNPADEPLRYAPKPHSEIVSPEVPGAVVGSDYLMVSQERAFQAVKTFGRDVPLELALGSIVPNRDQWTVHFDGELASKRVSWKGGNTWQEVIDEIEHREGIFIHVNPLERAIGVAEKAKDAKHFAHREPKVWDITGGTELRKVIANWADRAGWRVAWDASYEMEFTIAFDTRFYGDFEGEDGVLARLLASVSRNNDPLSARMHLGNDVIYIHQGGHRQSVQY